MSIKSVNRVLLGLSIVCSMTLVSNPLMASNNAMLDLLKILRDKGTLSEDEYGLLVTSSNSEAEKPEIASKEIQTIVLKKNEDKPIVTTAGKLEIKTADHAFRIGGRVQHDVTIVDNDGGGNVGSSEQQIRRARIYLSGTAWEHWDWKFQYDLGDADDGSQAIEDAYLKYTGFRPLSITVGQRKAPFSLSQLTSSRYITFIDRSAPSNLFASESFGVGGRSPGITLSTSGSNWTAEGGLYLMRQRASSADATETITGVDSAGDTFSASFIDDNDTDSITERKIDDGFGFTGRTTFLPVNDSKSNKYVHLGAAFGYKHYGNRSIGGFGALPGVSEGKRIVDSDGLIAANNYWSVGLEAAAILGPFSAQAEYFHGDIDTIALVGSSKLDGWSVEASYFLTGDSKRYSGGKFTSVKVRRPVGEGGLGAWELALRFSGTDLGSAIGADEGNVFTAALNWYVNNNMMFKANYVKTFCDDSGTGCDWGTADGDPAYFVLRTQLFF